MRSTVLKIIILKMKSIRKTKDFKDVVAQILLLRYGPARRPIGNYRVCTYSAIAKITSLSASTVRRIIQEQQ